MPSLPTLKVGLPFLSKYLPSSFLTAAGSPLPSASATFASATRAIAAATKLVRTAHPSTNWDMAAAQSQAGARMCPRAGTVQSFRCQPSLRQREHRECSAERGVVAQAGIAADRAKTGGRVGEAGRQP